MPEKRKYCKGNCGAVIWDIPYQPHRKYCDACNKRLAYERSKACQIKNYTRYRQADNEAHRKRARGA